jgi:hypothetical protein
LLDGLPDATVPDDAQRMRLLAALALGDFRACIRRLKLCRLTLVLAHLFFGPPSCVRRVAFGAVVSSVVPQLRPGND